MKWNSNLASHGSLAWAEGLRGRRGPRHWNQMGKSWRAEHSGVYSAAAGNAKWKSRSNTRAKLRRLLTMRIFALIALAFAFCVSAEAKECVQFGGTWYLQTLNGHPASDLTPMKIDQTGCGLRGSFNSVSGLYHHTFQGLPTQIMHPLP